MSEQTRAAKDAKVVDGVNGQFLSMDLAVKEYLLIGTLDIEMVFMVSAKLLY